MMLAAQVLHQPCMVSASQRMPVEAKQFARGAEAEQCLGPGGLQLRLTGGSSVWRIPECSP